MTFKNLIKSNLYSMVKVTNLCATNDPIKEPVDEIVELEFEVINRFIAIKIQIGQVLP